MASKPRSSEITAPNENAPARPTAAPRKFKTDVVVPVSEPPNERIPPAAFLKAGTDRAGCPVRSPAEAGHLALGIGDTCASAPGAGRCADPVDVLAGFDAGKAELLQEVFRLLNSPLQLAIVEFCNKRRHQPNPNRLRTAANAGSRIP